MFLALIAVVRAEGVADDLGARFTGSTRVMPLSPCNGLDNDEGSFPKWSWPGFVDNGAVGKVKERHDAQDSYTVCARIQDAECRSWCERPSYDRTAPAIDIRSECPSLIHSDTISCAGDDGGYVEKETQHPTNHLV
jgi:hypothetical protein